MNIDKPLLWSQFFEAIKVVMGGYVAGIIIIVISDANFTSGSEWGLIVMFLVGIFFLTPLFYFLERSKLKAEKKKD